MAWTEGRREILEKDIPNVLQQIWILMARCMELSNDEAMKASIFSLQQVWR